MTDAGRRGPVWSSRPLRYAVALTLFALGVRLVPSWWCARSAGAWYAGDPALQARLGNGVASWIRRDLTRSDYSTGSSRFDGEWLFGSHMMAGMGFGQQALAASDPAARKQALERMKLCIDRLLSKRLRAFDREAWGSDPLETLGVDRGADHVAYLGYLNLLLSLERRLDPDTSHATLNDRITAALVRRLRRSPLLLLQSYPREVYPVDNTAVIGSIGLHDRATGADRSALLKKWGRRLRERYLQPETGLLIQRVHPDRGSSLDAPRGSGTALAVYFLSFADPKLSGELYHSLRKHLAGGLLGFGMIKEYPAGYSGQGDIDSGPVILGYSVSATGFGIGAARVHGDGRTFAGLLSTAVLFGAPVVRGDRLEFATGGPLGNAILWAMLTAPEAPGGGR